jgi:hypothetical protein
MQSAASFPAKVLSHRSAQQQTEKQKKSKRFGWPVEVLKSGIFKICKKVPEPEVFIILTLFSDL